MGFPPRVVTQHYVDPLATIWLAAARGVGLRVIRTSDAYAITRGDGILGLGVDNTLDADDSLAQMIFHELCHWLVQGEDAAAKADWGLDNTSDTDVWREEACLRAQWVLAGRYGVRALMAPTTDFRALWDGFAGDVLADRDDASVRAAIVALHRAERKPWAPHLERALRATAAVAVAVRAAGDAGDATSLWAAPDAPVPLHPTGLPGGATDRTCGDCAWRYEGGPGHRAARCRQASGKRVDGAWAGCERFEAALDCLTCGACCREAYGSVEVGRRERFRVTHPELVMDRGNYLEIKRAGDRCAALGGGLPVLGDDGRVRVSAYACAVYDARPKTCRDFTLGSDNCLDARRRVGMSVG